MKTIKAIFTQEFQETPMGRRYSFNTTLDVEVGDLIESPDYNGKLLQVVAIEDKVYRSFSYGTGELFTSQKEERGYGAIKLLGDECRISTDDPEITEVIFEEPEEEGF